MKTYIPENTEVFHVSEEEFFLHAVPGSWQEALHRAKLAENPEAECFETAENLAGFYWWTCSPGCLPDSEASGPFETELEAIEDAGGGEYEDEVFALAAELGEDPADITEEKWEHYGLRVYSCGRAKYAVGTDEEADEAREQSLDSYLDDCGILDSIPENLRNYFDREAWKRDARFDGRGHALSSYDGDELELEGDLYAYRIN